MGVHFAPVTSHPEGMYVPVHCFLTDSQLCRHRSFTTHPEAHPADGAGRSQLHTQEECSQCPQPLRHHRDLWQSWQPDCRVSHSSCVTAFCWSPTSCHSFLLVTNKLSQLSAGHQQAVTAFCWSPTQQGRSVSVCRSSPLPTQHHSCQNTVEAKTPQLPKHCRCQNTTVANSPHYSCQNTTVAKTLQMPKHHRCQNTTDAKTPQMPNGVNWNGTTLLGSADKMVPSFTDRCDIYTLPRTLWQESLHSPIGVTYSPEHWDGLTLALLTRFSCFTNRCNMPTAPLTSLSHTLTLGEKTYRSLPHSCLLHHHWSAHQP